jgi:hypothetical protein
VEIYITRANEQFGPYSEGDVRRHLVSGELSPDDLAWHEGLTEWQPLSRLVRPAPIRPPIRKVLPQPALQPSNPPIPRYVVIAAASIIVLYLISPYFSLGRLRAALESGNRDSLESRIDFPSIRESLKDQLRIHVTKSLAKDENLKQNRFAGLATAFAPMMVNYLVDNFVTPSGISALIADSKSALRNADSSTPPPNQSKSIDWSKVHYAFFTSPTQFMVDIDGTKLRFRFTGFGWQLKKLEIPMNDA